MQQLFPTPFRIPRYVLARIAAEQYVRSFWWFVVIPPVFGLICLCLRWPIFTALGMLGLLWPLTIPARAVLTSGKAGHFFSRSVTVRLEDGVLYFFREGGGGMKLSLASIRKIEARNGYLLLIYGIGEFVAIPKYAGPELAVLIDLANEARDPSAQLSSNPS